MVRPRWALRGVAIALGACVLLLALAGPAVAAWTSRLERDVLEAVRSAGFDEVLDGRGPAAPSAPWYPRIAHVPQVEVAVLDLNRANRVRDAAHVLLSRDHPRGVVAPLDRRLRSEAVRYRRWDQRRWDGDGVAWDDPWAPGSDVVSGREDAPIEFMLPYPASVLKVMVAHGIVRLVDQGRISLADELAYPGGGGALCGDAATRTVGGWMEEMITISDNKATCALILRLHQLDAVDALNDHFAAIGLPSLRLEGTNPTTGAGWNPGSISMGALDTAKLFWLIDGAPGVLWRTPDGDAVRASVLSASSRELLKSLYARQGFKEVLATTNWCGHTLGASFPNPDEPYPPAGIPAATPAEFIQPDGTVTVGGIPYPRPVAPCDDAAEVLFSHKTGLTFNFGADAGYVHELPGAARRDYVIAVITNLGNRYTDPVMNTASTDPRGPAGCWTPSDVCYSAAFARLGRAVDEALTRGGRRPRR